MEWAMLILLWTWKCNEDMERLQRKAEKEERKFKKWLANDQIEFAKSLEGKTPEEVAAAYESRGKAIAAAITCATVAGFGV
jgi:hypothetical protein